MTMIMTDEMIMIDDDYRNCDDHHGSASSAVKSSFSSFARHHTSSSSATTHGNLRRFTERNTLRPVIISFSLKETRKNIIKYLKIMKKWPKLGTRSHPPSSIIYTDNGKSKKVKLLPQGVYFLAAPMDVLLFFYFFLRNCFTFFNFFFTFSLRI